nr:adipokinetic hormone [Bombyx mori]
ELTFTSSWG